MYNDDIQKCVVCLKRDDSYTTLQLLLKMRMELRIQKNSYNLKHLKSRHAALYVKLAEIRMQDIVPLIADEKDTGLESLFGED